MGWAEVSKVNSDFMEIPLDKRLDLADYKMYGEKSHVFQNKDRLHSLYECVGLSMNDLTINSETLEYFIKENQMGLAFASIYGIKNVQTLAALTAMTAVLDSSTAMTAVANSSTAMTAVVNSSTAMTAVVNSSTAMTAVANSSTAMTAVLDSSTAMTAVVNSSTAMTAVANSSTAMTAVLDSSTAMTAVVNSSTAMTAVVNSSTAMTAVLDSSTAMTAVANSSTAMTAVLDSSTAMTAVANSSTAMTAVVNSSTAIAGICKSGYNTTKAVIKAVNNNEDYIKKVFDTVTSDNSKFLLTANEKEDVATVLDRFCNTPNTIILCALGSYRGSGSTNLLINNELSKVSNSAGIKPSYVVKENCNAIAVPTATFTENGDGYAAIAVYKAI